MLATIMSTTVLYVSDHNMYYPLLWHIIVLLDTHVVYYHIITSPVIIDNNSFFVKEKNLFLKIVSKSFYKWHKGREASTKMPRVIFLSILELNFTAKVLLFSVKRKLPRHTGVPSQCHQMTHGGEVVVYNRPKKCDVLFEWTLIYI